MARPFRLTVVAAVLALLLTGAACAADSAEKATSIGDVVPAHAGVDTTGAPEGYLIVPSGRLDIRAGEPVESLDADAVTEREAREAPEGAVFLPVTWTFRTTPMDTLTAVFGRPLSPTMTLVSGGERYTLAPPPVERDGEAVDAFYVAVEGDGEDASVELEYAGVTQVLDLVSGKRKAGRAQRLYGLDPAQYSDRLRACPSEGWVDEGPMVQVRFSCARTDAAVVPFVDGKWAPKDSTFVVLGVNSNLTSFTVYGGLGSGAVYAVTGSKEKSELAGKRATRVIEERGQAGAAGGLLVFTVADGEVPETMEFRRTYTLVRTAVQGNISAPYERKLDIGGPLPLE